jgi:hypothetical protein
VVFPLDVPAVFPDDLRAPFCFALRDAIPWSLGLHTAALCQEKTHVAAHNITSI